MQNLIDNSAGYAVFPNVGKGGFIVGGAHGKGCVFEKGKVTGHATMTQASIGAQAGGQSFAEIIVFQSPTALNNFKSGNFEMSAGMSAVVASEGASKVARNAMTGSPSSHWPTRDSWQKPLSVVKSSNTNR